MIRKRKTDDDITQNVTEFNSSNLEEGEGSSSKVSKTDSAKSVRKTGPVRRYDDAYIEFGFADNDGCPQCVLCSATFTNESMKPSHLKRHLLLKHKAASEKPREYFERKRAELQKQKSVVKKAATIMPNMLKASYLVSLRIAKSKKPHTIGETLVLPCAIDMVGELLGAEAAKKIKSVPLSNDTVSRRISELSSDVKQQLFSRLRASKCFAIQADESTDVASSAQLLTYVRYPFEGKINEEMLFCRPLHSNTTGEFN